MQHVYSCKAYSLQLGANDTTFICIQVCILQLRIKMMLIYIHANFASGTWMKIMQILQLAIDKMIYIHANFATGTWMEIMQNLYASKFCSL